MNNKQQFSAQESRIVGMQLGLQPFWRGLEVELEHGAIDPETNMTGYDQVLTRKIAEIQNYYTRFDLLDAEAIGWV